MMAELIHHDGYAMVVGEPIGHLPPPLPYRLLLVKD